MNKLYVGFSKDIEIPKSGCLYIADELPAIPGARVFDPQKHSFNPLKNIEYKKAREIADVLYTVEPQAENTLTVRNGKRALLRAFIQSERMDKLNFRPAANKAAQAANDEAREMIDDLLVSPVLRRVLCSGRDFSFKATYRSVILARINRAELSDFDALVLGLFLMCHFKGQIVVEDFGFYGRDAHMSLIRENRLIAGLNTLSELPQKLGQGVLLIKDKIGSGATAKDADTLACYKRLIPGTNAYNEFVQQTMA